MKKAVLLSVLLTALVLAGCSCKKKAETQIADKAGLYGTNWELEYVSGTRIAFEGLYPEEKPTLILTEDGSKYGGNSSCNAYGGTFTLKGTSIKFGDAMKTMRFCEGGGEQAFMSVLGKVNKYSIDGDGKLVLLQDDVALARFKKATKTPQ